MLTTSARVTYSPQWLALSGMRLSQSSFGTVSRTEVFLGKRYATVLWDSGEVSTLPVAAIKKA